MAAVRVGLTEGATVRVRGTGRTGTVLSLTKNRTGQRGRPSTLASVVYDDGSETTCSVRELSLI